MYLGWHKAQTSPSRLYAIGPQFSSHPFCAYQGHKPGCPIPSFKVLAKRSAFPAPSARAGSKGALSNSSAPSVLSPAPVPEVLLVPVKTEVSCHPPGVPAVLCEMGFQTQVGMSIAAASPLLTNVWPFPGDASEHKSLSLSHFAAVWRGPLPLVTP